MQKDLMNFKRYYQANAPKVPADSFFRQSMNHKYKHSIDVLHWGEKILQNTPELVGVSAEFMKLAEKALLFHDVGRFDEAIMRFEAAQKGNLTAEVLAQFDHGLIGYELLKDNPQYNDLRILFAVQYHGKMMQDIESLPEYEKVLRLPEKDEVLQILYLVRDADKLANLQAAKSTDHLKKDIFYKQLTDAAKIAPLSENVKTQFFAGKVILSSTITTFADRILQVLSWIYDFNYQYTKTVFLNDGYAQFLFDELSKYHTNDVELQKIEKIVFQNSVFKSKNV